METELLTLTLKALEHPQGLEVINAVLQLRKEMQVEIIPDPFLKAKACEIAKSRGIHTALHVNNMTNSALQAWIKEKSV